MKFVSDNHNNVGRHCNIYGPGIPRDTQSRCWRVFRAMRDKAGTLHYMVKHVHTGVFRTIVHTNMTNLY